MPSQTDTFHFPEVRVVEASAGSGKTYALAKRYIQLLLDPKLKIEEVPIRSILAITFTNKAAFEMKERILKFLKQLAFGKFSPQEEAEILAPIGISPDEAAKRAFSIMELIIRHYNFFQVQTIDKFINALLSGCAFKIGLTANFKIKTNSDDYLLYSLDNLIDLAAHNKDIRRVFESFLHNYLYLENRTGWFPKNDMHSILATLFAQHNTYGVLFNEGPFLPEDIIKKKRYIYELIKELNEKLPEGADKRFMSALEKFIKAAKDGWDVDALSSYFAREFLPLRKGVESTTALDKLWDNIRTQLKELCEEEAFSIFNPYVQSFNLVLAGLREKAGKDDVLFLGELNKKAGELFDKEGLTVQEMYYRLATRFRHYLIDEFQDTSRLQWRNLKPMAEEALSTGGSLFYVGDRKQAIYGFRGGEVALFDELKESFRAFNVVTETLAKNYRSARAIVEFNNTVFSLANLKTMIAKKQDYEEQKNKGGILFNEEDIRELEHIFEGAHQSFREGAPEGYCRFEYIDLDKKEERDEVIRSRTVAAVKDLLLRYRPRDIAVLTRNNMQIETVTNWLLHEGLQVESDRTSNIKENTLIQDLIFFLKFLDSPIDNSAFAQFLLSGLFAKASGLKPEALQEFLLDLRPEISSQRDFTLYTEFRSKHKKIWDELLAEFFQNVGLYPLYEMLVSLYNRFGLLEHFQGSQAFLMHFLELVKEQENDHPDLASFLEYFEALEGEELFINISRHDAIRLLTVHKSKGLEFPVVILPFLGMDIQVGAQGDNQQAYMLLQNGEGLNLVRRKKQYLQFSQRLSAIYRHEYKKAFISELNTMYVALTRAKSEMVGFIPKKVGISFNFASFLIPEHMFNVGEAGEAALSQEPVEELPLFPPAQYEDWIVFLKEEFQDARGLLNRAKCLEGELMHFLLSFVGNLTEQSVPDLIKGAAQEALQRFPNVSLEEPLKRFEKILKEKALQPFLAPQRAEVFCEKEVVDRHGITKRLDRLIVADKEVIIVDYKSSEEEADAHRQQVNEYRNILSKIYQGKKVTCYLVYLDSLKVEEVEK